MPSLVVFIIGVGLALFGMFMPARYPDMPSSVSSGGILLGVALVFLAAGLYIGHRRSNRSAAVNEAEIRLRTYGDNRTPERISQVNIWRWFYLRNIFTVIDNSVSASTPTVVVNLFVTFDRPVRVGTLVVSSPDFSIPMYEVKDFDSRSAVIAFHGELPAGTIVLRVHQ